MNKSDKMNGIISFMLFIFWLLLSSFDLRSLSGEKVFVKKKILYKIFNNIFKGVDVPQEIQQKRYCSYGISIW